LYNQGILQVQVGNYIGATQTANTLVSELVMSDSKFVSTFTNASFLLWLIGLNKFDIEIENLWLVLSKFAVSSKTMCKGRAVDNAAFFMTLASAAAVTTCKEQSFSSGIHDVLSQKSSSWFARNHFEETSSEKANRINHDQTIAEISNNQSVIQSSVSILDDYFLRKITRKTSQPFDFHALCPRLLAVEPRYSLAIKTIDNNSNLAAESIYGALRNFSSQKYSESAQVLNTHRHAFNDLGGHSSHRDILEQTMIEAYLRDGQYEYAKLLLCERCTFVIYLCTINHNISFCDNFTN
jgi:hypothetical protein